MGIGELIVLSIGLAMDAFAVAICKGLSAGKVTLRHMVLAGLWFGGFQAGMPFIGYLLGSSFARYITPYDHWIAFGLLGFLGAKMLKDAFGGEEEAADGDFGFKTMLLMAIATSIDALIVGVPFASPAMADINIGYVVGTIGVITFIFAAVGVEIGAVFGNRFKNKAQILGGVILIGMGTKILLEHMNIIAF
jgi:putative Mn2+ efflux pump MntP